MKLKIFLSLTLSLSLIFSAESCSLFKKGKKQYQPASSKITRTSTESLLLVPSVEFKEKNYYPWEDPIEEVPMITKYFFQCKGSSKNPPKTVERNGIVTMYEDCGGAKKHGLPVRNGEEFIYPILIELLNYIQRQTKMPVIITSGHRCPEHNAYVDSSMTNLYSKHGIGAAVNFYVKGLEKEPQKIVDLIIHYYQTKTPYNQSKEYTEFQRMKTSDTSSKPWSNKEIYIKIFTSHEGRTCDDNHTHPYIELQVRYDRDTQKAVVYTWDEAKAYRRR